MMIFTTENSFNDKVNFVDQNNVVLGYDMKQDCCEYANWFIADYVVFNELLDTPDVNDLDLNDWYFDTEYFTHFEEHPKLEDGKMAVFRITNGTEEKYIHLYNCQNGFYSHGFELSINKVIKRDGAL